MTISSNYITLQSQIADELGARTDLLVPGSVGNLTLSPIQNAIQNAIAKFERMRFYFNDLIVQTPSNGTSPFMTAQGQEYYGANTTPSAYALIANMAVIDKLWVLVSNNRYTLNPRTPQYMDDTSVNPSVTGQPVDYAYSGLMLRFYPIPDNAYPVGVEGTYRLPTLVNNTDANAWTQDAEPLIRAQAKLILAEEVIFDDALAARTRATIYGDRSRPGYLYDLQSETARRKGGGRIRPTQF